MGWRSRLEIRIKKKENDDVKMLHPLAFGLAVLVAGAAQAADPPSGFRPWSWDIPILRGEYMPTNGGTLGTLSVGYTDDANRTFGGATMFYDAEGNPVTQAVAGQVHFNDDAVVSQTGVIAWTDVSFYALSDGPCRGCADHPRSQQQTADTGRFEWTGPRGGRLTVNGQTQDMVEAFSGPPLIADIDLSGYWFVVERLHRFSGADDAEAFESFQLNTVRIVAPSGSRTWETTVSLADGYTEPYGSVPLPPAGSREFDVECIDCYSAYNVASDIFSGKRGVDSSATIWLDASNRGRGLPVRPLGSRRVVTDQGMEHFRAYATQDRIVFRRNPYPAGHSGYGRDEILMIRMDSDAFRERTWMDCVACP